MKVNERTLNQGINMETFMKQISIEEERDLLRHLLARAVLSLSYSDYRDTFSLNERLLIAWLVEDSKASTDRQAS